TWLKIPEPISRGSAAQNELLGALIGFQQKSNEKWSFEFASQDLEGSFDFRGYLACGYDDACGKLIRLDPPIGGVGAETSVFYKPTGDDPRPSVLGGLFGGSQLHWIQRVKSNHGLNDEHGVNEDVLDVSSGNTTTPYYASEKSAGFSDAPRRSDYKNNHTWDADLYLAAETKEGDVRKVTIYNGVSWGWRNLTFRRDQADICPYTDPSKCTLNPANVPMDLAMVFDTTGSMGAIMGYVKNEMRNTSKFLFNQVPDTRIAVVDYKDFSVSPFGGLGDYPYRAVLPFSSNQSSINAAIGGLTTGGGGDTPESLLSALVRTLRTENLGYWRNKVKKSVIYITDAPAHDPEPFTGYTWGYVVDESYLVDPAILYAIVPNYLKDDPKLTMVTKWTGGRVFGVDSPSDAQKALAAILAEINGAEIATNTGTTPDPSDPPALPNPPTPRSVPEPSSLWGFLAVLLAGGHRLLKKSKCKSATVRTVSGSDCAVVIKG
ncbi:VWA domain-containing protein, partial [Pseudanabaenaceae cyanobacterium LEGE 13415]|nr:VWA domain-containing protein [Pseudanabaenaceae cyanobacterium LEGE 13415]